MQRWPHQLKGRDAVLDAIRRGARRLCLTSPTGCGKSVIICDVIDAVVEAGWDALVLSNRKILVEQLQRNLDENGIDYGVRAAGYDNTDGSFFPVQISSLPTEKRRVMKAGRMPLHGAGNRCLVIADEAHCNAGPEDQRLFDRHVEEGHTLLGVTATPIGLEGVYHELIVAGTVSEGRACGALVPAIHYAPDEPSMKAMKLDELKDTETEGKAAELVMRRGIFGRVWANYCRLNPERLPAILFAPGVSESLWFAEQFTSKGVRAASITGDYVWLDGERHPTSREAREEVLAESKAGRLPVICNRFVLREGIDAPWLRVGIFATIFGSLQTYLQSGGRLLRKAEGKDACTVIDHGGNWWRFGSLNEDRPWHIELTEAMAAGRRFDRIRQKPREREPFLCPQCQQVWSADRHGRACRCGYVLDATRRSRPVVSVEGDLVQMKGTITKPKRVATTPDGPKRWEQCFWRARSRKTVVRGGVETTVGWRGTFRQAFALFARENGGEWPDASWPFMPLDMERDSWHFVEDVPFGRLVPKPTVPNGTVEVPDLFSGEAVPC